MSVAGGTHVVDKLAPVLVGVRVVLVAVVAAAVLAFEVGPRGDRACVDLVSAGRRRVYLWPAFEVRQLRPVYPPHAERVEHVAAASGDVPGAEVRAGTETHPVRPITTGPSLSAASDLSPAFLRAASSAASPVRFSAPLKSSKDVNVYGRARCWGQRLPNHPHQQRMRNTTTKQRLACKTQSLASSNSCCQRTPHHPPPANHPKAATRRSLPSLPGAVSSSWSTSVCPFAGGRNADSSSVLYGWG